MSAQAPEGRSGSRIVEGSSGGAFGVFLIQLFQAIDDPTVRELAISSVPFISVMAGYLIHVCYQFVATDWPLKRMNREFDETEQRLRGQLAKHHLAEEERVMIQEKLVELQQLRTDAEISRIKGKIEKAPGVAP